MSLSRRNQLPDRRRCAVERLETRQMMTGNVEAFVENGTLYVNGDAEANVIQVDQVAQGWVVKGFSETTVNGQSQRVFANVTGDIVISLKAGNDQVAVMDNSGETLNLPGNLIIETGSGRDTIVAAALQVKKRGGDVRIDSGTGTDGVLVHKVRATGDLLIHTGTDAYADSVAVRKSNIGGRLRVATGGGADQLLVEQSVADRIFALMGSGSDAADLKTATARSKAAIDGGGARDALILGENTGLAGKNSRFERVV